MTMFKGRKVIKVNLERLGLAKIMRDDAEFIERPVSAEEVRQAVWSCNSRKAPGYDGFNFSFIKEMWDIIGDEFTMEVIKFFEQEGTNRVINTTWVTFISKSEALKEVGGFRPISMVGLVYKIIAKILSARLKPLLPSLVNCT